MSVEEKLGLIEQEVSEQTELIGMARAALQGKAVGGGSGAMLDGKTILMVGDSWGFGFGWEGGFANLIRRDFQGATVMNYSVSGAIVCDFDSSMAVFQQLVSASSAGIQPDIILMDGGGNDMLAGRTSGEINLDGYGSAWDTSTAARALDTLFYIVRQSWPTVKIVYYTTTRFDPDAQTGHPSFSEQQAFWAGIQSVCGKHSVRFVDNFSCGNVLQPSITPGYWTDWLHIGESGYEALYPQTKAALLMCI